MQPTRDHICMLIAMPHYATLWQVAYKKLPAAGQLLEHYVVTAQACV